MSDLPRLLFCCFDVVPGPSAISRRLTEYIKGLSERFQVVVLSAKTPDHPHIERYHGARLLRVPVGSGDLPARSQTFDRAVRRQLESEEYGLVHFFDPFAGYALCERRSELGYRLVYDACTFPSVELPLEHPSLASNRRFVARVRRQELFCLMNADGVVVGSPLTSDYVAGLGVERDRVRVLRAPVALEPFTSDVMGKPDATPMKVLHLGRITQGQGLELMLEALQLALQTVDIRLTLVGPKNAEAQGRLEARVGELKLAGKVEFQEPVHHDDIHKVLATADVGALALDDNERNRTVGTPLARLGEYLAAGRPVIAADLPGVRALMPADGLVLYRPGDARSLADALVQLAADTARRVKLGAAARAAATEWDSARVRLELLKLYADVTGASAEARADAAADPFEPTQMGASPAADTGEVTQSGARARASEDSNVGTNKVKTDPAIAGQSDSSTDANAKAERPPIMGTPLRDDAPALDAALQAVTEPGARPSSEPPVVMGAPLREPDEGPATAAKVAAAMAEASPAPLPAALAPPVNEGPLASFDDDVRTDLRAPAELSFRPAPVPSVPTVPEGHDATAPFAAPAAPAPPDRPPAALPGPDEDEPFVLPNGVEVRPRPGPPVADSVPEGSVAPFLPPPPGVASPRTTAPELTPTAAASPALPEPAGRGPTTIRVAAVPPEVAGAESPTAPPVPPLLDLPPAEAPTVIPLLELPAAPPGAASSAPKASAASSPAMTPAATAPATLPGATSLPAMAPATAAPATPPSSTSLPAMTPAASAPATRPSSTSLPAMAPATASPATRPSSTSLPAMPSAPPTTRPSSATLPELTPATPGTAAPAARGSSTALPPMTSTSAASPAATSPATRPSSTALPAMTAAAPAARPGSSAATPAAEPTAGKSTAAAVPPLGPVSPGTSSSRGNNPGDVTTGGAPALAASASDAAIGASAAVMTPEARPTAAPPALPAGAGARPSSTAIPAVTTAAAPGAPRSISSTALPAMPLPPGGPAPARPAGSSALPTAPVIPAPPPSAPASARAPASDLAAIAPPPSRPGSTGLPAVPPPAPNAARPGAPSVDTAEDEVAEIDADEVMDVDEPSESVEEIMDADEAIQTVDTDPSPPPSALDPWLAQLVHGYCPPESHLFDRHTPPTTMPGRDT